MIPIQGKPLIDQIVRFLSKSKIVDEIIIVANFTGIGSQIGRYFENHAFLKKPIRFVQDSQSGTGGDLLHVKNFLESDREFLLWFVDNLSPIDINRMYQFHKKKNLIATIAVRKYKKEDTGYAIVKDGVIKEFKEKPLMKLPMSECLGIYILDSKIMKVIRLKKQRKKMINLSYDILQSLSKVDKIGAYDIGTIPWIDIDSPTRVERNKELISSIIKKF